MILKYINSVSSWLKGIAIAKTHGNILKLFKKASVTESFWLAEQIIVDR